jgi:hypothetical protein
MMVREDGTMWVSSIIPLPCLNGVNTRLLATGVYFSPGKRRSGVTIWRSGIEKMMNYGKPPA